MIDESGDEGFSFDSGSSSWFIISAVVIKQFVELETVKLIDEVRRIIGKPPNKPLHFRDLKHEQRIPYVSFISKANLKAISILIHKPSLLAPETFKEGYRLYFYTVKYLLERISWYCRDHKVKEDFGDGSAEIIFSNKKTMSYEKMKEYLNKLKANSGGFDLNIDWDTIKIDQIKALNHGKRMGLQIADAVAGSFFFSVEPSRFGFTNDAYVKLLKPVIYNKKGVYSGYGFKFWPKEALILLKEDKGLKWFENEFQ
ncbi:MAG: DUF3800 domain-containing protein [Candidatus Marinimicrobia bacterium]|nr:DUF3800 domain-containing protein [Candidatus Neomarinimicrobiota bacterium]